jgi:putative ABC transport system permease protein
MTSFWQDLRFGLRTLRKNLRFSAIAIFTLALGVGSTTAIWSVVDCVLLHPFPYSGADRLATPSILTPDQTSTTRFPVPVFLDFKKKNHSFENVVGLAYLDVHYKAGGATEQFLGGWVTPDTFEFLGVKPLMGRQVTDDDGKPGSPPVLVISHALWTRRFNRDPKVLGTVLTLNGTPRTLIAIMPPRFRFGDCDLWMPLELDRSTFITGFGVQANELWTVGRLKSGISLQTASADLEVIAKPFEKVYPAWFREHFKIVVNSVKDDSVGQFKNTVLMMMGAVSLLLLIACCNVANLLLARATVREKEMAIRASVGATESRLVRQLLVESGLLVIGSCIAGCILAFWGLKGIAAAIPPDTIPSEVIIAFRPAALSFAICVSVPTIVACGLAPALKSTNKNLRAAVARRPKNMGTDVRHAKLRSGLLIAEVALSIVLLIGAGLLVRSLLALERVDVGFDPAKVAYANLSIPEGRYDTANQKEVLFRKILDRLAVVPGVIAASEATSVPPYSFGWTNLDIAGKPHSESWGATFDMCSEGYFDTLGRQLLRGRLLSRSDVDSARHVALINQTLARAYFGNEDPIGQKIKFSTWEEYGTDWPRDAYFEIIGVIADAKNHGLQKAPKPELYFPHTVTGAGSRGILVRTVEGAASILPSLRQEIAAVDPDVVVTDAGSIESFLKHGYYSGARFTFLVVGMFASVALLLVLMGLFSVMVYNVSLRTQEIGIRMALGAQKNDVLRMVLVKALILISAGTVAGLAASLAMTRLLTGYVWGVSAVDPWTYSVVGGLIFAVGLAACLLPALRAAQVDPLISLRYE